MVVLLFGIAVFVCGCAGGADADVWKPADDTAAANQLQQFAKLADDAYQKTVSGRYAEARDVLLELGDMMPSLTLKGATTIEGVQALSETILQGQLTFNAVRLQPDEALAAAGRIMLAVDALTHKHEPMWRQYGKLMREDAAALEQAAAKGQAVDAKAALDSLLVRYAMIRPAALVSGKSEDVERLKSLFGYLQPKAEQKALQGSGSAIKQLRDSIGRLFDDQGEQAAYLPLETTRYPLLFSLLIGAMIASVLAYAAWRMLRSGGTGGPPNPHARKGW
ncbi:sporulation protein YpjB [Paenibacillus cymbidii]|uniref:sporulation protein YpjB n=1 Tax=Paenibacillus cymbidii TaxID=1639034 RepID=UPI0014367C9E|nr:sporulation protein YpjB [Paenibacillus cymbidii]